MDDHPPAEIMTLKMQPELQVQPSEICSKASEVTSSLNFSLDCGFIYSPLTAGKEGGVICVFFWISVSAACRSQPVQLQGPTHGNKR